MRMSFPLSILQQLYWYFIMIYGQQAGKTIAMDADATSALQKKGISTTNDIFKFTWKVGLWS